jgi:hypothetical protein
MSRGKACQFERWPHLAVLTLDQTARTTLKRLAFLWLAFFLLLISLGLWAQHRVRQIKQQAFPALAQPSWSEDESQVAYLAQPPDSKTWQLWRVGTVDHTPTAIASLDAGEWSLLGWVDGDRRILLKPRQQSIPRIVVVDVKSGKQKEIRFESDGLQLVGVRGGQVFFQRHEGQGEEQSLALLTWEPGDEVLTKLVNIPFETEKLNLANCWPSLNGRWLALEILMGDSGQDRTLWFYDKTKDDLRWSGLRMASLGIGASWSADSAGLVAAIQTSENCDLYRFDDIESTQYTKLSAGQQSRPYQPFWPRGEKDFLLLEKKRVYRFDPEALTATQLTAPGWEPSRSRDLDVSPRGNYAAFVATVKDNDQLFRVNFKASNCESLLPEHAQISHQKDWWFILGESLSTAWEAWTPW